MARRIESRHYLSEWIRWAPNWLLNVVMVVCLPYLIPKALFTEISLQDALLDWWSEFRTRYV